MTLLSLPRIVLISALAVASAAQPATASRGYGWEPRQGEARAAKETAAEEPVLLAQADCSAAAAQAAAQTGGQVLSVSSSDQGGQTVCVVTVLIPGQGGERPRRTTITLPG